jgi:DNA-binding NtrC family response regulator
MRATVKTTDVIIGDSREMQDVMRIVRRAAPTDANVLILGENGTGKELIARELHRQSARADKVFLTVDMGSLSESLFEAELFGHKKGAFTNANEERLGRFQAADGGTLFLDEIGNLPLHLQAKLLRVLEERTVTPIGANNAQAVDVRIIAATNMPPLHLQDDTQFRQDLLFRLNTVELTIPPLRERRDDILAIAEHFVALYARKYHKGDLGVSAEAIRALKDYEWPGNVRALRHAIERAVILGDGKQLKAEDLQLKPEDVASSRSRVTALPTILNLDQLERVAVKKALAKHGFNISKTAAELGLTRASLYRRMEKHDL